MKIYCAVVCLSLVSLFGKNTAEGIHISGSTCGQKYCKFMDYCNKVDYTCQPCKNICNSSSHNFEPKLCENDCQDYLHDERYMKAEGTNGSESENLRAVVQRLSHLLTVTLTLVCLILVVLATILGFWLYRWKQRENITIQTVREKFFSKKSDSNANKNPNTIGEQTNNKPDLRLEITTSDNHSDNSPVTMTTSISRRPAEDTLEYAYDNPAMSRSPNGPNKPHERTF